MKNTIPSKDQVIWVKNLKDRKWVKRTFSHFVAHSKPACFVQFGLSVDYERCHCWDEYSLYDPKIYI